jgi:acyl-CoA thioester hydrolase
MEGVRSVRHCEIHAQEKGRQAELRAKSKTILCMIDADTKRPKRIPEEMKTIFM